MIYSGMVGAAAYDKRQLFENMRMQLETERSSFTQLWRNLNDYILPTRGRFQTTDANRGDRRSNFIIDSTASLAARTTSAGMSSGITSPARPWFRLTTPDPDLAEFAPVKEWLHVVTDRLRWVLAKSNFYNKCPTIYGDLAVFGTAGLLEVEDDHSIVRFADLPVGSIAVSNGPDDRPAVVSRLFRMTVRQLVTEFGLANVSNVIKTHWQRGTNTEAWYDVVNLIVKNDEHEPDALLAHEKMPWVSYYYEIGAPYSTHSKDHFKFLRGKGYNEMPVMIPVWETTGEDVYGTNSPGILCLGDVRQLQTMERRGLQGLEKMVNPPMTGPTALRSANASILPGAVTYVDTRDGMSGFRAAHETQIRLDQLEAKNNGIRGRINESFFVDLFQMMRTMDEDKEGRGQITAAEVYERHEEKLLVLGPVLEQLNTRLLDPVIHRTFNISNRRGFILPPPPDLNADNLKIEYISMMHEAQKSSQMGGFNTLLTFTKGAAEMDPSVVDKINIDRLIEHVNESAGNPPDVINPQEEVDKIRQARAKAQAAARQTEQLAHEAEAAKKLSQADTSKKNALTDFINNPTVPGSNLGGGDVPGA